MKKVVISLAVFMVTCLVGLALAPFIFRDAIITHTLTTLNRKLEVDVSFQQMNISLFREFPRASLSLDGLLLRGKGPFEGDTLLSVARVSTTVGIFDLFTPRHLTLLDLQLRGADLRLKVNGDNLPNWQIMADSSAHSENTGSESDFFTLQLDRIEVEQGRVLYSDDTLPIELLADQLSLSIRGDLTAESSTLDLLGVSEQFSLSYDGTGFLSRIRLGVDTRLTIDFNNYQFDLSDASLLVNRLPLGLTGSFSMPADSMLFDFHFSSGNSTLSEILALIPPDYESYLEGIDATGEAEVKGSLQGYYLVNDYPAFDLQLKVTEGWVQYRDMPADIRQIAANVLLSKPQGSMNDSRLAISEATCVIRNNPVMLKLALSNWLEDLKFDTEVSGKIDFNDLRDALPFVSEELAGAMTFDITARGNYSEVENRNYNRIYTSGNAGLSNFRFTSRELTMPVYIPEGKLLFTPAAIQLQQLQMEIGESQMNLTGRITDYYEWLLSDGDLNGSVTLTGNRLNLDELMQLYIAKEKTTLPDSIASVQAPFQVPENWNMRINAAVRQAVYDQMAITNIRGAVVLTSGTMALEGLTMELLDGNLALSGSYRNSPDLQPLVDLKLDISRFDLPTSFQSLGLVRHYLPVAAHSRGRFGTSLVFKAQLGLDRKLIMSSLNGNGRFTTQEVQILDSPVFNQIKAVLSEERLRNVTIDDFTALFTIEAGNLLLPPFETRIAGQQALFTGSLNTRNILQMQAAFLVSRDALSPNIERMIGLLPGQRNIQMFPVGFTMNGPVNNPEVKVDLKEATDMVKNEVKNATREELQRSINRLGEGLRRFLP